MSDIQTTATQTLRYFNGSKSEFLIVYILEFFEPLSSPFDYETAIKYYMSGLPVHPHFALAIWPNQTNGFAILEGMNYRENLDTKSVLQAFEKYDPALIGRSTNLKPLNRSFNDFFHLWARQNMKGFQNDIDAFIKQGEKIHMLELKRPKESVNTWKPYLADSKNYMQLTNLCSQLNYDLTNIAYTESQPGKMKIFKDVTLENQKLHYVTANLEINPDDDILLKIDKLEFYKEMSKR